MAIFSVQVRRTILYGTTRLYYTTTEETEGNVTVGEEEAGWVWLDAATEPPREAPSITVITVRDTGCLDHIRQTERKGGVFANGIDIQEKQQLGDAYHRAGRWARETWYKTDRKNLWLVLNRVSKSVSTKEGERFQRCRNNITMCIKKYDMS